MDATFAIARDGLLTARYALAGDIRRVRVPEVGESRFADELWQHTCFELFARGAGESGYCELNCSPSGEWALYRFDRYREGMRRVDGVPARRIAVRRGERTLEVDVTVSAKAIGLAPPLALGVSAVVEEIDGTFSYWALRHPAAKPDFHHPEAFALQLQ